MYIYIYSASVDALYIYIYSASVDAFTLLIWWMHVYKFAAVMTNAQQRYHIACAGKIMVSVA